MSRSVEPGKKKLPAKAQAALDAAAKSANPLARCKPRGDRVVVRRDGVKPHSEGGILLPDSVCNKKQQTGIVISVGPGNYAPSGDRMPLDLKPGDAVIIVGYAGLEVGGSAISSAEDSEYVMLRDEDVVGSLD